MTTGKPQLDAQGMLHALEVTQGTVSIGPGGLNGSGQDYVEILSRASELNGRITARSLALTDAGQAFYDTCTRVLNELAEAEAVLAAQRTIPVGRLMLTVPHTYGRLHVLPLLNPFCLQYPEMQLSLSFSDRFVDLFEEGVDVAIRIGGPGNYPPSLSVRYQGCERLIFCASPAYLAQHGTPQSLAELEQHRAIVYYRGDGSTSPWHVTSPDGRVTTRTVAHRMALGDGEAQRAAVMAG
ncbi:LysR family transcriptional regulator, partial [bacteria symbiont BFo1 of Frankliniella occidentalis]